MLGTASRTILMATVATADAHTHGDARPPHPASPTALEDQMRCIHERSIRIDALIMQMRQVASAERPGVRSAS